MQKLNVGSVEFVIDTEHLVFADQRCGSSVRMALGHIPDLIRFLQGLDYREYIRAFRVPTDSESGLSVIVSNGVEEFVAVPNNLSLVGISAEVDGEGILPIGAEVSVNLSHEDKETTLEGIVRRREDSDIGIEFHDCFQEGSLQPPEKLRQIVAALETLWIRARAQRCMT